MSAPVMSGRGGRAGRDGGKREVKSETGRERRREV